MSNIKIQKIGITKLNVDAIVNAANEGLWEGGGVCGAIFAEAGSKELTKACKAIGGCKTGSAVITPGFNLSAKYIIHAVGPRWNGGNSGEPEQLYDAYKSSLELAMENNCHSIAFPLISAGIFGYPKEGAWRKGLRACETFINKYPEYDIEIIFAVLDQHILELGEKVLRDIRGGDDRRIEIEPFTEELDRNAEAFCRKYVIFLEVLFEDDELRDWCANSDNQNHKGVRKIIYDSFMEEAYDSGVVIKNYDVVVKSLGMDAEMVGNPTDEMLAKLSKHGIVACIAYLFRMDHWNNGHLEYYSLAKGVMLKYVREYIKRCDK